MIFHPALTHLAHMRGKLVGFGALFRRELAIDFGEFVVAHCRQASFESALFRAQLTDGAGVVRPDRLQHLLVNLLQLPVNGPRVRVRSLQLRSELRPLSLSQIQEPGDAIAALLQALRALLSRRIRLRGNLRSSRQEHPPGNRWNR